VKDAIERRNWWAGAEAALGVPREPCGLEPLEVGAPAFSAGAVTGGEGGDLIQEK
jgi:hypothetical protein